MDRIDCIRTFVEVARRRSFREAADFLDISAVHATRQVAYLESELKTRLLNRTTRSVSLTPAGAAYHEKCLLLLDAYDEAMSLLTNERQALCGTLRLTVPGGFHHGTFAAVLAKYSRLYPDIEVDLLATDRPVSIVEEGYDLAIRIANAVPPNLIARQLATIPFWFCASPAYVAAHGQPATREALSEHPFLGYAYNPNRDALRFADGSDAPRLQVRYRLRANSGDMMCALARQGMGIAMLPAFQAAEDIARGELLRLLPDIPPIEMPAWVVYANRSHLPAKSRLFIDMLLAAFRPEADAAAD